MQFWVGISALQPPFTWLLMLTGKTSRRICIGDFFLNQGYLHRADPGFGDGTKRAWLLPVLVVLNSYIILQFSKYRRFLWNPLNLFLFLFPPPTAKIHLLLKALSVRACLSHQWRCRTIWWEIRKKILILNIHCPCFLCSSRWEMCAVLCLLLACVPLYLVFRVSSFWWLMETCHKLFLVSLQAWKSSLGSCA